jgi:hypothetical protein
MTANVAGVSAISDSSEAEGCCLDLLRLLRKELEGGGGR